ncbi:MAG: amidohydrolase family protein [Bryobacteraceae bacterium]|nr:amidohydrolase family protein [Bryobacteraceae bacterium]MDW8379781.1 amidohydrolase family protein [Bryobacterales bacterium]
MIAAAVAILNVTLIDGTGAPPKLNQTVLVRNGKIFSIGPSQEGESRRIRARLKPGETLELLSGDGKYLIPGLWDMHAHVLPDAADSLLRWGITGVRNMHVEAEDAIRLALEAKRRDTGPRIVTNGVIIDGPNPVYWASARAVDRASAMEIARRAKQYGLDFLKVYDFVPREAYFALAEESKRTGLPLTGHVPLAVRLDEAVAAGQKSIEHLSGIFEACSSEPKLLEDLRSAAMLWTLSRRESSRRLRDVLLKMIASYDASICEPLLRMLAQNKVWQCPTLVALGPPARQAALSLVGQMHRMGVPLLAGTDAGSGGITPGESLHEELELLVRAGLTAMEALQTATLGPAQFLGEQSQFGTVEKGRLADLVLLDANPLEDIRNTRRIAAVISRGRVVVSVP